MIRRHSSPSRSSISILYSSINRLLVSRIIYWYNKFQFYIVALIDFTKLPKRLVSLFQFYIVALIESPASDMYSAIVSFQFYIVALIVNHKSIWIMKNQISILYSSINRRSGAFFCAASNLFQFYIVALIEKSETLELLVI